MTKSELLAALADLPGETPLVLDVGLDTFLDLALWVDDAGVRVTPANDEEGREFVAEVRRLLA